MLSPTQISSVCTTYCLPYNIPDAAMLLQTCIADGVPPMMQQRHPPAALQGLAGTPAPVHSYRYVILNLWIITITRRSISLGIATASLTFVALQVMPCFRLRSTDMSDAVQHALFATCFAAGLGVTDPCMVCRVQACV